MIMAELPRMMCNKLRYQCALSHKPIKELSKRLQIIHFTVIAEIACVPDPDLWLVMLDRAGLPRYI
jgi:hypothetical protein